MAWPQDGDSVAYVNIHHTFVPKDASTIKSKGPKARLPWSGRACRTLNEAVKAVDYFNSKPDSIRDIYFCTSTQGYAEPKTTDRGFQWFKAVKLAENAVKLKSLFIDIDLVDGKEDKSKGYDDMPQLIAALGAFLKASGLPRPTIMVSTGGGMHIYWCLLEALTVKDWLPLAYALAEATRRHGLKCDTQCTIDAARVLRVPGTTNYKYDPPRKVKLAGTPLDFDYLNARIEASLAPYKVQVPYSVLNDSMTLLPPKAPLQGVSDLSAGIDMSSLAPVNLDTLVHECGFIAEALATGGASFQNPLWNLTTLIATFAEGGRVDAHRMANGHLGYGPGETDELFDRKVEEKLSRNLGWPKCATIAASGSKACASCKHFTANRSPLNFAPKPMATLVQGGFSSAAIQQQQGGVTPQGNTKAALAPLSIVPGTGQQDPDLPDGYLRNAEGVILYPYTMEDGSTTWFPVSRYPMIEPWMQRDPWTLNFTTETEFGKLSQITVPCKDVGTSEMKKALQDQGLMVTGGTRGFNNLTDFIMAWITKLQSTRDSVISSVPFGWLVHGGGTKGFVYGGKLHTPTGEETASNTDPELQRQFSPEGDIQPWRDAAKMITSQRRPALDAILASAFAAPLVRFTGHSGLLMSAYSIESGIGKSTALKVAQAVWGDPVKAVQSLSDTQNSVLNKMGELRSLPMYWDELKSEEDTKRFVDTVFRLTLGKEKSRMTSKVTQRTPGTWQTIMVAASNESLMDSVASKTRATTAGLYRVFEFTVNPAKAGAVGQIDPTVAQRMVAKLHDNYGNVGYEYASYLGRYHAQVETDVGSMLSMVAQEVNMKPDERFWVALIGSIMLGAQYANALGFTTIDEAGLKQFMYATLTDMRKQRNSQPVDMRDKANVVNTLARFLNESRARHTLYTNIIYRGRGKPAAGAITVERDASKLDGIRVHVGMQDKVMRIGQSYLYDWLSLNNYPRHVFLMALQSELGAITTNGRLGSGTSFANASEFLIELDLNKTALLNFIDEL
jgi:hypothetical protein